MLRSRNDLISALVTAPNFSLLWLRLYFQPYITTLKCIITVVTEKIFLNGGRNELLFILAASNLKSYDNKITHQKYYN